jgi:hypothetical protein
MNNINNYEIWNQYYCRLFISLMFKQLNRLIFESNGVYAWVILESVNSCYYFHRFFRVRLIQCMSYRTL